MRLSERNVKALIDRASIDLSSYKNRAIEKDDVIQDSFELTLRNLPDQATNDDFVRLFWNWFGIMKKRTFDKKSGKNTHYALVDGLGDIDVPTKDVQVHYENQELVGIVKEGYPILHQISIGLSINDLSKMCGVSARTIHKRKKDEVDRIRRIYE